MRKYLLLIVAISLLHIAQSQTTNSNSRLKVFIDCSNTRCDMDFIRTEINLVDFMLDNEAADLHILITRQPNGGGGSQFQLIFFGQHSYKDMSDTIRFDIVPNATDFEIRDVLLKYLKLGMAPYVAHTVLAKDVVIQMKKESSATDDKSNIPKNKKDPWNYWVFRIGTNGYANADEVYKQSSINANFSATRVTEDIKIGFEMYGGKNRSSYEIEDDNGDKDKIVTRNNSYNFQHYIFKSINSHWSYGYMAQLSHSTFSNNKNQFQFNTGIEYDIFPYKQVNTKLFTISYMVDVKRNVYLDTTLYDKLKETLWGHGINSRISFNQKWGSVSFGLEYHNYFKDWKYFNLGAHTEVDIRITGGLSFNIYTSAELTHDQLFLEKGGATPEEVLTRQRQLASGYFFFGNFGISYRFGSKLNNYVNPRFE